MSILIIRNDDDCEEVYNRTTVFCYTKMPKNKLWDYVWKLELLTEDRQAFFFKVDLDIFAAPATMPELSEWCILSVILKSLKRPFSFGILVKLFLENFPYRLLVDFSDTSIFICSGALNGGKVLSGEDHLAFQQLSTHHKKTFENSIKVSERYKKLVTSSEEAPSVICQLAQDYNIRGGHWLMFFNRLDISKREPVFDILFKAALNNWGLITRFNAKISADSFIVCFGNNSTISITDPSFLVSDQLKSEEADPVPKMVREIIDKIYDVHSAVFGFFGAKYKPDIISACCIQRDNFIRPTVYQANYGFYYENFQPLPAANSNANPAPPKANPASTKAKSSTIGSEVRQLNGMHDYEL